MAIRNNTTATDVQTMRGVFSWPVMFSIVSVSLLPPYVRPASRKGRSSTLNISQLVRSTTSWITRKDAAMCSKPKTMKKMKETFAICSIVFFMWLLVCRRVPAGFAGCCDYTR